ncbi:MAG: ribonuclease P protein component [Gallionellaceae bacterium]
MKYAFPPDRRVGQSQVFEQAFRHKGLINKWFTISLVDSKHDIARLGMVVSKRTISKSVSRNYVKRMIRETFRHNYSNLPALDFIVRIRRGLPESSSVEAKAALLELLLTTKIK